MAAFPQLHTVAVKVPLESTGSNPSSSLSDLSEPVAGSRSSILLSCTLFTPQPLSHLIIVQNGSRAVLPDGTGACHLRPGALHLGLGEPTNELQRSLLVPLTCRPIQFSPTLVDRLSHPPSEKPKSTDEVVRQRLAAEAAHIRQQEAEILEKISAALEKENLDKEKPGMSSEVLGRDIEEVREKVQRMRNERSSRENEEVRRAKEGVVKCYL